MKNSRLQTLIIVGVLAAAVLAGLFWVNLQFAGNNPGGNDFLVHYIGTRSFLFEGLSPYSDEVALRIQTAAYGHAAEGIEHELRVAYPLYSILFFAPFSAVGDYLIARALWMTVLEIALVVMCLVSLRIFDWRPGLVAQGLILLFSLLWYHAVREVVNGNAAILIAMLITIALYLIKSGRDKTAGVLLALTTIKPHLVILLVIFIVLWALRNRRKDVIIWFLGTVFLLTVFSWILLPDWIVQNLREILRYPGYNPAGTLAAALSEWFPGIAAQLRWGIAVCLGLVLILEWGSSRINRYPGFIWAAFLTLVISQWIGIQTDPGNFIVLFPAVILILAVLSQKWSKSELGIVASGLGILLVGIWALFLATIQRSYQPIQSPVMFLPLPAFCLIGLYWVKWWAVDISSSYWLSEQ